METQKNILYVFYHRTNTGWMYWGGNLHIKNEQFTMEYQR